ncbi:MAG: homocysteine S-methyltransferase family protein [Thermovirga sp.]
MNGKAFGEWLASRGSVAVMDGGMGSLLAERGWSPPELPEEMNERAPEMVHSIHNAYVEAGASIIETNTFGGSSKKLALRGLAASTAEINRTAAAIARSASRGRALVAGSAGPLGELLQPFGALSFEEAREAFRPQMEGLFSGGADFILVETMMDIREAMAAVLAVKDSAPGMAFAVSFSFDTHGKTVTGTSPEVVAHWARSVGACAVGANCGVGPEEYITVTKKLSECSGLPVFVYPNAGVPGRDDYRDAKSFSEASLKLAEAGASVIGGCCGTTEEHIRALSAVLGGFALPEVSRPDGAFLSSRSRVVASGPGRPLLVVGERINMSRKSPLRDEVAADRWEAVRDEASLQANAGAGAIDINMGLPGIDQVNAIREAVRFVQQATDLPLSLDSDSLDVIEAGLGSSSGIPLINSVTAKKEHLERGLRLASRYGACLTVLLMDEGGIPETARERIRILERVLEAAKGHSFPASSLFIDALTLAAGAVEDGPAATVETIREIARRGARSILGISNVSHGLPCRPLLNRTFLAMAMSAGLDAVIADPLDVALMETVSASESLVGRDPGIRRYIAMAEKSRSGTAGQTVPLRREGMPEDPIDRLKVLIVSGDTEGSMRVAGEIASDPGFTPMKLIQEGVVPALERVGVLFDGGEFFLPQLLAAAQAAQTVCDHARGMMDADMAGFSSGRVILATVEGDLHDLGKNVVGTILGSHGFEVVDLGRSVPIADILEAVRGKRPDVVGLSALMTTTMPEMGRVVQALEEEGLDVPVIVGGACVTQGFADSIGAAGYASDAVSAVGVVARVIAAGKGTV